MVSPRTKIFLADSRDDTIINDFEDGACLSCISDCCQQGRHSINCQIDGVKRHVFLQTDEQGKLYVCDDKERTTTNFKTLVDLIKHCRPSIIKKYSELASDIKRAAFKELDALEHNIVHINADAINEFYSFITQDTLVTNYWKLQELIAENISKYPDDAIELISKLTRYNLNIKTELSVAAKLNNPDGKPSYNIGNPRDAIMSSVYMLYPMFKKKKIFVKVAECWDKFEIDYDALQVASFYIVENATKYVERESLFSIQFLRSQHSFRVEFVMRSLHIDEAEQEHIFQERYRGSQAQKATKEGKGIGLYRAKRLAHFMDGELSLEAGEEAIKGKDGLMYSDNKFVIELPYRMPIR